MKEAILLGGTLVQDERIFRSLDPNRVWVWYASLRSTSQELDRYWRLLSHDERVRAQRFYWAEHRDRFVTGRGILRNLLGHLSQQAPKALRFDYNRYGKPTLSGCPRLQFNLSHSQELAVYAFTLDTAIGVDVEYQSPQRNLEGMTKRCLTPREYTQVSQLSAKEKLAAFFKVWVRKEACLKALGCGLSYPLTKIEVNLSDDPACFTVFYDSELRLEEWSLYALTYPSSLGFAAALAIKAAQKTLQIQHWPLSPSKNRPFASSEWLA